MVPGTLGSPGLHRENCFVRLSWAQWLKLSQIGAEIPEGLAELQGMGSRHVCLETAFLKMLPLLQGVEVLPLWPPPSAPPWNLATPNCIHIKCCKQVCQVTIWEGKGAWVGMCLRKPRSLSITVISLLPKCGREDWNLLKISDNKKNLEGDEK